MGMDPEPLVAFFSKGDGAAPSRANIKNTVAADAVGQSFSESQMTFRERPNKTRIFLWAIVVAVVAVIGFAWHMKYIPWHRPTPKASPAAAQKAPEQKAPEQPAASSAPVASGSEAAKDAQTAEGKAPLKMTFTGESWVQIQREDSKKTIAQFMAKAGETKQMDVEVPSVIVIGNVKSVSMEFRNAAVDLDAVSKGNTAKMTLK